MCADKIESLLRCHSSFHGAPNNAESSATAPAGASGGPLLMAL
jgi:hypothetical protein